MLAYCELLISHLVQVSYRMDAGDMTAGFVARAKGIASHLCKEVHLLAREVCGGNGIILDNHVIKQFIDLQGLHTGEGTYEVNMLVSGRELTGGLKAFK